MKRKLGLITNLLLGGLLCLGQIVYADNEPLKKEIDDLKARVEKLEKEKHGLLSSKGFQMQIGGVTWIDYNDWQTDTDIKNAGGHDRDAGFLALSKSTLTVITKFNDYVKARTDFEFDRADDGTKLDYCFIEFDFKDIPTHPNLKLGMNKVPYKPNRRTARYPLIGSCTYRDEEIGLSYNGQYDIFCWGVDCMMMRDLDDVDTWSSGGRVTEILQDDRNNGTQDTKLLRLRAQVTKDFDKLGKLCLLPFIEQGKLDDPDIATIMAMPGYKGKATDDKKKQTGVLLEHKIPTDFGFKGEAILHGMFWNADDGKLERSGWYGQISHQWKTCYKFLQSIEPLVRSGIYEIDGVTATAGNVAGISWTWNRKETTFALLMSLVKNVNCYIEYIAETADQPGTELDLNVTAVRFEIKY